MVGALRDRGRLPRARPTCSCGTGRPGPSSRSSPRSDAAADDLFRLLRRRFGRHGRGRCHVGRPRAWRHEEGSAYVFVRSGTTWSEQQKLTASDARPGDSFGWSVAVSGDTAVVGAYVDDHGDGRMRARPTCSCGAARSGPSSRSSPPATRRPATSSAGLSPSRATRPWSGPPQTTTRAVAMRARPTCSCAAGRAGASSRSSPPATPTTNDAFGDSVALSGDTAVVGAHTRRQRGRDAMRARPTCSCAAERAGPSSRSSPPATRRRRLLRHSVGPFGRHGRGRAPYRTTTRAEPMRARPTSSSFSAAARDLLHGRHVGQRLPGLALRLRHPERHRPERLHALGLDRRGPEGRPLLLRHQRPAGQPVGQRDELPVRRAAGRAHADHVPASAPSACATARSRWTSTRSGARPAPSPPKNPGAGAVVQAQLWYRDPLSTSNQTTSLSDAIEFVVGL